jgi:hypothetical protein
MTWYQITYSQDEVAKGKHTSFLSEFMNYKIASGHPDGLALFHQLKKSQMKFNFSCRLPRQRIARSYWLITP